MNRKAVDRVASGHLWIYRSDVVDTGKAQPGAVVEVRDPRDRPLGTALFSSVSQITLRLMSRRVELDFDALLRSRLQTALALREQVVEYSNACRLVYGEGDLLPGLVVDRYGDLLVLQTLNQAMAARQERVIELLTELLGPQAIVARNDVTVRSREELPLEKGVVAGQLPADPSVRMNGLLLYADLLGGQKTGIFLDQRENYVAVRRHAHGRLLDCFASTGGFGLHAAATCDSVELVDSSAGALHTAERNAEVNGLGNVTTREANVFDLLPAYVHAGRRFSTIILDPPAFTKTREGKEGALRGYKEINQRALRLLDQGGILVTCSCSHHVTEADLLEVVAEAANDTHRTLRVRERRTQAQDHPILLTVPETHYLKCLIVEVV